MGYGRKITGGRYLKQKKKKLHSLKGHRKIVKLGEEKRRKVRIRSGEEKSFLLRAQEVNVEIKGKTVKAKIKDVIETPSNRFFARQNIITKGTVVETDKGNVKITNRPTQEGMINGILLE